MAASSSVPTLSDRSSDLAVRSFRVQEDAEPAQRALDSNANNYSPPSDQGKRSSRYARRALLWGETKTPRLCSCGRGRHAPEVSVRLTSGVAGFAGVKTCGNVWICPVCNAKIMARRALELGSALALAERAGLRTAFLTFTMRHHRGQRLTDLWDAVAAAWKAVTTGAPWIRAKERHGVVGWVRVVEVNYGSNGWHVHVHALMFFEGDSVALDDLHEWMFGRWSRKLVGLGFAAPLMAGQDAQLVESRERVGQYLAKAVDSGAVVQRAKLGQELTNTQSKIARDAFATRTVWDLLDGWFGLGDADDEAAWREFEAASRGRRQIAWSRGLREYLGMTLEKTDEEIAAEELGTRDDDLVRITANGWRHAVRTPDLLPRILAAAEATGLRGLRSLLDSEGVEYVALAAVAA